ncbi:MAG: hypothetical protein LBF32_02325 [Streptococcaceae bacterium]|nr:hypothetical protein [Streptococcaceae bacterium]
MTEKRVAWKREWGRQISQNIVFLDEGSVNAGMTRLNLFPNHQKSSKRDEKKAWWVSKKMRYEEVKQLTDEQFQRLTGVNVRYDKMLPVLQAACALKKARGGRFNKLGIGVFSRMSYIFSCWR